MSKNGQKIDLIRESAAISTKILYAVLQKVKPGISAAKLDKYARELCQKEGVTPAFLNYAPRGLPPFPSALSVCVNDEVVHGISSENKILRTGDIVTLDFGVVYKDHYSDMCVTVGVEKLEPDLLKLLETSKLAVLNSIQFAQPNFLPNKRGGESA